MRELRTDVSREGDGATSRRPLDQEVRRRPSDNPESSTERASEVRSSVCNLSSTRSLELHITDEFVVTNDSHAKAREAQILRAFQEAARLVGVNLMAVSER